MKSNRTTITLLVAFFGGLLTLWGLERAGVLTNDERALRVDRVLPDMMNTPAGSVQRVAIDRGDEHLVFERRGRGQGRWQMLEPLGVAAEPTRLETLVRNLKELRKSPDAGTITGSAATFGLDPPAATVRLFGGPDAESHATDQPIAALEAGKAVRGIRYVRPAGIAGIEVADARLLAALDLPAAEWREPVVMGVPTFQVTSLTITRRDSAGRPDSSRPGEARPPGPEPPVIRAERSRGGPWKLTAPITAPANGPKIESLLAALASLRVVDGSNGFVADNVKDLTPFGLAAPAITVELTTSRDGDEPMVLDVGKSVPDRPDRIYVRQGGQDDVVIVNAKALAEIPHDSTPLRSQQVADIVPAAVTEILIRAGGDTFSLTKEASGWELTAPRREKADRLAVESFLNHIDGLQTSEFLDPAKVPDPRLDPPVMTIQIRQAVPDQSRPGPASQPGTRAAPTMALDLRLGRDDVLKKTIYAQLEKDQVILALPDTILEVLPKNQYAFRDRTIITDITESPARIRKLTIRRGDRTDVLEPNTSGEPNRWRMRAPVDAQADTAAVTQALTALSNLRAEDFAAGSAGDGRAFGLDRPEIEVTWESDRAHRLKIGAPVPRTLNFYATLEEQPFVFTLGAATVRFFDADFHDRHVWSFPAARAERVVLRWPHRTVALRRRPPLAKGQLEWVPDPGTAAEGIDLSRISALVRTMSQLEASRYFQYDGPLPAASGLRWPRLVVEVTLAPGGPNFVLRIGSTTDNGQVCAAVGIADSGPAFFLPAPPWNDLIHSGESFPPIPDNPFAPER